MIIIDLIYNLSLLIAVSVVSNFIDNRYDSKTKTGRILQGILFGLTAVIGMMYPFELAKGLIFDGRTVILSLCSLFFGPLSGIIAGIIALIYRADIGGPGVYMGLGTIIEAVAIGIVFYYYKKRLNENFGNKSLILLGIFVHITMILMMLGLPVNLRWKTINNLYLTVLTVYPIATLVIGKVLLDNERNKQLIKNIISSELNLKKYIDHAPDAVFVVNREGKYIDANPAAEKITGYSKEEILQQTVRDFITQDELDWALNHFTTVLNTGNAKGESKFVRKDGSIGWWTIDAVKINDDKFLGFSKDITEKKLAEIEVAESLAKFQSFFELAPYAMLILRLNDYKYLEVNQSFVELSAYSHDELVGHYGNEFHFWADEQERNQFFSALKDNQIVRNQDVDFLNKYGNVLHCSLSGSVLNIRGEKLVLAIISDQTQKRLIEIEINKNERKFRDLIEKLPDGFYQSTPEGKFIYVNPAFVKILGYSSKDELMSVDITSDLYFEPEERDTTIERILQSNNEFEIYRLRCKDGSEVWIEEHSRYLLNDEGNIIAHEGICRDITDRIKTEEYNKELVERIEKVSSHLPGFIFQYCLQPDGRSYFPFASEGINRIYGVSLEDVKEDVRNLIKKIVHHDDIERLNNTISESARNMTNWHAEYRIIQPDGRIIWVEGKASPELESDGSVMWHGYITDITLRKISEQTIKASEESLQIAQEIANMGSWDLDLITNQFIWSPNYYKIQNYDPNETIPSMERFFEKVHPEDLEFVKNMISEFFKNPQKTEAEYRIICANDLIKWLHITVVPIFDHDKLISVKGTNVDITERKISEDKVRTLSRAIEQNPLAVVITNLLGKIEYVNPKFSEVTGFNLEDAIHKTPRILKSGLVNDDVYTEMWADLLAGYQWQGELINKKKNGDLYWSSLMIAPVTNEKGKISHYIAISEDVTEKIEVQKELVKAKEKAEESDRLKSAFLANMSHEIRTPMNGIIGFSRMLTDEDIDESDREEYVQLINFSCDRLLNTVNDILDISKIEAHQMELKLKEFNVNSLLSELIDAHTLKFKTKGLSLINDCQNLTKNFVVCNDEQKLYQILNNLITNAYKFTDSGVVNFGFQLTKDNFLEFYVKDSGIGISTENQLHIFGRFNQGDSSLNRPYEGSGLGLAICKGLTEILGGRIWVESIINEGSTFRFTIPYHSN